MAFAQGSNSITLDDIYSSVGDIDLLSHYLGISEVPCIVNSPLRKDNRPTFGFYSNDGIKIHYTDLSNKDRGGVIDLFAELWNTDFKGVLKRISDDLPKIQVNYKPVQAQVTSGRKTHNSDVDIQCKVRNWKKHDIDFWEKSGISLEWLKFGDVYPISHTIITNRKGRHIISAEKYAYAYVERKANDVTIKIYEPYSETFKWTNKHDSSVWDFWTKIPESGENLIITSSRKDALCVWENTGIPCVSLQAESYLPKHHVMDILKARYKQIYVLYDNDFQSEVNNGRMLGRHLANEFNLIQIEIPDEYKSKDPSDLCKNHGRNQVKNVISKLIIK